MKRKLLFLSKITLLMVMISFVDNVFAFDFGTPMQGKFSYFTADSEDYDDVKISKNFSYQTEKSSGWVQQNATSLYVDENGRTLTSISGGIDFKLKVDTKTKSYSGNNYYIKFKNLYTIDNQDVDVKVTFYNFECNSGSNDLGKIGQSEIRIYVHEKPSGYKFLGFGVFSTKSAELTDEFYDLAYITINLYKAGTSIPYTSNKLVYYFKDIDGSYVATKNGKATSINCTDNSNLKGKLASTELAKVLNTNNNNIYLPSKNNKLLINNNGVISGTCVNDTDNFKNGASFVVKDSAKLQNEGEISLAFGEYMTKGQKFKLEKGAGRVGQTDIQFKTQKVPTPTCEYTKPSDFPNNSYGTDCCKWYKENNYARLRALGKSVEQFKEDYPLCFDGKKVNYTVSTPKCERADNENNNSQKTAYIRPTTESLSQDNWIWLLNNNTVSSTNIGKGTCNLVCYEKIELSLPLFPYGSIQPGQHFVWPNNNPNNKFEYRPLTSKTTKVCRVMTNKVIDDATKSACQSKFDISKTGLDSATISVKYNNSPYSANEKLSVSKGSKIINNSEYGVYYKNSNLGNRNSATQYTISSNSTYSLPKTLFAYSPKNKLELPKSSIGSAEASKYVNVGYGNLPVSLDWERKTWVSDKAWYKVKTYTVWLNVQTPQIGNKKISYDYTCKFVVDDFCSDCSEYCPKYSQKPDQNPKGFQECMTKYDYGTCVANYCYNKPYCPKDCTNGDCRESKETLAFRDCIATGGVGYGAATCMARECPQSTAAVYRTISLDNPFPGFSGNGRKAGYNWSNPSIVKKYITDTKKYYDKQPMYEITLGPKAITEIRNYNSNAVGGYLDFNLNCTNGKECRSDFIRTKFKKYFSNTCGMSTKWNACDSR